MKLHDWINPAYLDERWIGKTQDLYAREKPFPHIQLPSFLLPEQFSRVEHALSEHEFRHNENDLFAFAQTEDLTASEHPVIKEYVAFLNSDEFRGWVQRLTRVPTAPGEMDLFGAVYQDTDHLLPHDDQLDGRQIACILSLTTLAPEEGGALILYESKNGRPQKRSKHYQPVENTLTLFSVTPESWHEVDEVVGDAFRVSIGGWLHG